MEKKGLSPIIATLILVSVAVVLAVIIFIWARGFMTDQTLKFDRPIQNVCEDIQFSAEARLDNGELLVSVVNEASVPLYGVEVRKKSFASIEPLNDGAKQFSGSLNEGSDEEVSIDAGSEVESRDELLVVPIIVGESGNIKKSFTCDTGEEISVI